MARLPRTPPAFIGPDRPVLYVPSGRVHRRSCWMFGDKIENLLDWTPPGLPDDVFCGACLPGGRNEAAMMVAQREETP